MRAMSRVIFAQDEAQMRAAIAGPGYTVIIFMRTRDLGCEQLVAKCAEYSREFPHVRFCALDIDRAQMKRVGTTSLSHVPTCAFYRAGALQGLVAGTDYARIEARLVDTRRDGTSLIGCSSLPTRAPMRTTVARSRAIFPSRA